jgi:hypothetical protein
VEGKDGQTSLALVVPGNEAKPAGMIETAQFEGLLQAVKQVPITTTPVQRAAENAVEGTKKAAESIPGAETILKKMAPESKESKPVRPTDTLEEKPSPKSLFEQLLPYFEKNPGSPLPMPRGMNPLKVNGNALDKLYASAKDVLGAWDVGVVSGVDSGEEKPAGIQAVKASSTKPTVSTKTEQTNPATTTAVAADPTTIENAKNPEPTTALEPVGLWARMKAGALDLVSKGKEKAENVATAALDIVKGAKDIIVDGANIARETSQKVLETTIGATKEVMESKAGKGAGEMALVLFPGTMPVVMASEAMKDASSRKALVFVTEKTLLEPAVTLTYSEKTKATSELYHQTYSMTFLGEKQEIREIASYPKQLTVRTVGRGESLSISLMEGFVPVIGSVSKVERSMMVGDYTGAVTEIVTELITKGPKLIVRGAGALVAVSKAPFKELLQTMRLVKTGVGLVDKVDSVTDVLTSVGSLANRGSEAHLTVYVTERILNERFKTITVPEPNYAKVEIEQGERIFYPENARGKVQLLINENGQISLLVPVGDPLQKTLTPVIVHNDQPIVVRNYYGLDMDLPDLYNITQEVAKEIRTLDQNQWVPIGLKYEKEILEIRERMTRGSR